MNYVLGGGKRLTVEDLIALSRPVSDCIALDEQAVQRLDETWKASPDAKTAPAAAESTIIASPISDGAAALAPCVVRAGLISRISSLLFGRSLVRADLVRTLASLVNSQVTPLLSSAENSSAELVAFLEGRGSALHNGQVVSAADALQAAGASPLVLFPTERSALAQSPFFVVGLTAIVIGSALQLARIVDPISALACEAAGANADLFDPTQFETHRQHRGQMQSATNLKALFEGSKRVTAQCPTSARHEPLHCAPQTTGPALDALLAAYKAVDIELNSGDIVPLVPDRGLATSSAQCAASLATAHLAIEQLLAASRDRTQAVVSLTNFVGALSPPTLAVHPKPLQQVADLAVALACEASTASMALKALESAADVAEKEKPAEGGRPEKAGKPQVDDSNLTAEQRAKAEAKRLAKAEKAAQKAAAKEQRRGGAVVVGTGSASVRGVLGSLSLDELVQRLTPSALAIEIHPLWDELASVVDALHSGGKRKPKIAKGTRDFIPEQMRIREQAFNTIRGVFKRHGGVEIDTPVFELKEVLMGKYGEDSKLIYDLADQGGELLSLRYDLTVPFARFLAMNSVGNIKRYHMAKVYRRDNPVLSKGRYREFYQCDFDIAGSYNLMVPDAEVITIATEILSALPIGPFLIKLNHRKLLDAIFDIAGVPSSKFRSICSSVDKLDKMSWEEVKKEMVEEKGLASEIADKIGKFVLFNGPPLDCWQQLETLGLFSGHAAAQEAMQELKVLFSYLEAMGSLAYISFDLSLARGLDYYTGVIYEAVLVQAGNQIGSIAAGGRYDQLVGMFSPSGAQTPCVGISIGVERVFTIMERQAEKLNLHQSDPMQVYIASIGPDLMTHRMQIARELWKHNVSAEYAHQDNPKFKKQLDEVLARGIPFMVVFGGEEVEQGVVKVKDMRSKEEVQVKREDVLQELLRRGCKALSMGDDSLIQAMKLADGTKA